MFLQYCGFPEPQDNETEDGCALEGGLSAAQRAIDYAGRPMAVRGQGAFEARILEKAWGMEHRYLGLANRSGAGSADAQSVG